MNMLKLIITLTAIGYLSGTAFADPLPKDAVKLTQQEVEALYSGKSIEWSRSNGYFSPDSRFVRIAKDGGRLGEGKWSVRGNELCADYQVKDIKLGTSETVKECWTWHKQGKKYWTLWSGEKDQTSGYYNGELKKLSKGDKVTKKYQELLKSN